MFRARPPAKVNLTLEIVGRRPDGYHELRSTFVRIGLSDSLTVAPGSGPHDGLTVTGLAGAPTQGNLVLQALDLLRGHAGINFPPLDLTLEKRIPVGAGLAGGSSDAAAALRLAQAAWGIGLGSDDELRLGASLGADVPFFLAGVPAAQVSGVGEQVVEREPPATAFLLVTPPAALSTAAVFAMYDELVRNARADDNDLWSAAAAIEPSLAELRETLEAATGRSWLMSGSGSTLFALYPSAQEASEAGRRLVGDQPAALEGSLVHAVDLVGPDPAWRYP